MELMAEHLIKEQEKRAEGEDNYELSLRAIRTKATHARHSILYLFKSTRDEDLQTG